MDRSMSNTPVIDHKLGTKTRSQGKEKILQ